MLVVNGTLCDPCIQNPDSCTQQGTECSDRGFCECANDTVAVDGECCKFVCDIVTDKKKEEHMMPVGVNMRLSVCFSVCCRLTRTESFYNIFTIVMMTKS